MKKPISMDLRERIVAAEDGNERSREEVANLEAHKIERTV
jgi:hypothetical protein